MSKPARLSRRWRPGPGLGPQAGPAFRAGVFGLVLAGLAVPAAQAAEDRLALAKARACMACHQMDARRVGPPLREVAARYAGADVLDYLATAIREGGRGRWGAIPMPAQPQVSPAEAIQLAEWILSLQPGS